MQYTATYAEVRYGAAVDRALARCRRDEAAASRAACCLQRAVRLLAAVRRCWLLATSFVV